jgi:hypothetical protein
MNQKKSSPKLVRSTQVYKHSHVDLYEISVAGIIMRRRGIGQNAGGRDWGKPVRMTRVKDGVEVEKGNLGRKVY